MCKKMEYGQKHCRFADYVYVRVSFFSNPKFLEVFWEKKMSVWTELMQELRFVEKPLTTLEAQLVDVDEIADSLDITLEEILSQKVYFFSNALLDDYNVDIFLSRYFIFLKINLAGKEMKESTLPKIYELLTFSDLEDAVVSLQAIELGLWHKVCASKNDLWNILDSSAFKSIDEDNISANGTYFDEYNVEDHFIETRRYLRQLQENEMFLATIQVKTDLSEWNSETPETIWNLLKQESTRCFIK